MTNTTKMKLALNSSCKNALRDKLRAIPASELLASFEQASMEYKRTGLKADYNVKDFLALRCELAGIFKKTPSINL